MASKGNVSVCAFLYILSVLFLASIDRKYTEATMAIRRLADVPEICSLEKDKWKLKENPVEQTRTRLYMPIENETESYDEYMKSPFAQDPRVQPFAANSLTLNLYKVMTSYGRIGHRLNISWTTPLNVTELRGFLLNVSSHTRGMYTGVLQTLHVLRLYNRHNALNYQPNQLINSECLVMGKERMGAVITVSSLPRTLNNYVQAHLHYVDLGSDEWKSFNASNWLTLLFAIIYPQSSTVKIQFVSAPAHVGFVQYTVCIKSKSCHNCNYHQSKDVRSGDDEVALEFGGVLPGVYDILLIASKENRLTNICEDLDSPGSKPHIAAEVRNVIMVV